MNDIPAILSRPTGHRIRIRDRWKPVRILDGIQILRDLSEGRNTEVGGEANRAVELAFRELTGCTHVLPMNSGTSALHSAYFAIGLQPGDEVIVPSYTWFATATPLFQLGVKPVFAEIDPRTLTLDPEDVERRITESTKAICVVHVWGNPAKMNELVDLCNQHDLILIEDCSHAHGATFNGKAVGSFGAIGCFSLQGGKAVSGGEAGVAVTNNPLLYDRMLALGHNGRAHQQAAGTFDLGGMSYGLKYRPHLFSLRLAAKSFSRLPELNRRRCENLNILTEAFAAGGVLEPIETYREAKRGGYLEFIFRFHPEYCGNWSREAFVRALQAEGFPIGVDRYSCMGDAYRHLHEAPIFTQSDDFVVDQMQTSIQEPLCLPTTEEACSQLVTIPAFVQVPKRALLDFARSVERIQQFAERNSDFRLL